MYYGATIGMSAELREEKDYIYDDYSKELSFSLPMALNMRGAQIVVNPQLSIIGDKRYYQFGIVISKLHQSRCQKIRKRIARNKTLRSFYW